MPGDSGGGLADWQSCPEGFRFRQKGQPDRGMLRQRPSPSRTRVGLPSHHQLHGLCPGLGRQSFLRHRGASRDRIRASGSLGRVEETPGAAHDRICVREYPRSQRIPTPSRFSARRPSIYGAGRQEKRYRGWTRPKGFASRSFYRFSNSKGTDSVSGHFGGYFSWADWIDISGGSEMPETLKGQERAEATA